MSQWSHVNITLRIDSLRLRAIDYVGEIVCTIGAVYNSGKVEDDLPRLRLPELSGSEGCCEVSIWENQDVHSLAAFQVSIFGDLRDKGPETIDEIATYLATLPDRLKIVNCFLRSGVAEVQVEYHSSTLFLYDHNDGFSKVYTELRKEQNGSQDHN